MVEADFVVNVGNQPIPTFDTDFELSGNLTQMVLSIIRNQRQARKMQKLITPKENVIEQKFQECLLHLHTYKNLIEYY